MKSQPSYSYRPDIDGLRALAVLAVIGFHAFPNWVKGGFIGVDVFFVISGFLITQIILKDLSNKTFTYRNFYSRRILRIFPALIAVLIPVLAFGWYVLLPDEFAQLTLHVAGGSAFVSNVVLWREAGYFDNAAETKPLLHLWSLAVEQQYYLVWPVVLFFLCRVKSSYFYPAMTVLFLLSFGAGLVLTASDASFAFYMIITRFWELMAGGLLAAVMRSKGEGLARGADILSILGLGLIGLGVVMLDKTSPFPGYFALLPVCGAVLIIAAGMKSVINRILLGNPVMARIGLISYPLYLWHWPLLVFAKIVSGDLLSIKERLILIAVSFVLAALTYVGIEKPLRKGKGSAERKACILLGSMVVLCLMASVMVMTKFPPRHNVAGITRLLEAAYDWDFPGVTAQRLFVPNLRAFEYVSGHAEKVVYLGDSNIEQYGPRIAMVVRDHPQDYRTAVLIGNQNDCNVVSEIFEEGTCAAAFEATEAYLKINDVRAVVLAVSGEKYMSNMAKCENRARMEAFIREQKKISDVYIVLNAPDGESLNPRAMFEGERLSALHIKGDTQTQFDYAGFMGRYAIMRQSVVDMAQKTGAVVIDPLFYLCPEQDCPILDTDERPLYKDSGHIRPFYARREADYIDMPLKVE